MDPPNLVSKIRGFARPPELAEPLELLRAGLSAEHLGPNDAYYWDDFWGVAGLRCAVDLLRDERPRDAADCECTAADGAEDFHFLPQLEAASLP